MNKLIANDIKTIAELNYNWHQFDNKTILISGGTGLIGSFLIEVIKYRNKYFNSNVKVISLSRHEHEHEDNIKYIKCDITEDIKIEDNIDYVIHLASNTHPKQYADDPIGTITTNIIGCNNLLKLAVEKNIKRFFLASSVEIYGQCPKGAVDESYCGYIDCNKYRSGYNEAKRTCEALCQSYNKKYGVDCVIGRFARVIGIDKKNDTKAIAQFMNKALNNEDIVLKSLGAQKYSYLYVADAVSAIFKILLDGDSGEAYNIAGEDENKTLYEYAKFIAKLAKRTVVFDIADDSSVSKATYALLDCNKLKMLNWQPLFCISDSLNKIYIVYKGA